MRSAAHALCSFYKSTAWDLHGYDKQRP
jgi:hypothetical protein